MIVTILTFILILGLLIFVHELGHFLMARWFKIAVEEFAFGFPPRLISWKRGETRYALNLLPFGGYVRLLGEDGGSTDPRSFGAQRVRIRLAVVVAGVGMNFLLAIAVFWIGFGIGMVPPISDPQTLGGHQTPSVMIANIQDGSPAAASGLMVGDILKDFRSPEELRTFTQANIGQTVMLPILRDDTPQTLTVTLSDNQEAPLGVAIIQITKVRLGFFQGFKAAVVETYQVTAATLVALGDLVARLVTSGQVSEGVSGPIGIYQVTASAVNLGVSYVLQLLALLSINLGLLNILPIPALDGSRALFVFLEGVVRRKVLREDLENLIHGIGFIVLLILLVLITYHDILKLN